MVRGPVVSTGPSVGYEYILLWAWLIWVDIDCYGLPWFFYAIRCLFCRCLLGWLAFRYFFLTVQDAFLSYEPIMIVEFLRTCLFRNFDLLYPLR